MPQGIALLLTVLIEGTAAAAIARRLGWCGGLRAALVATVGVVVTHPLAWPVILRLESALAYLAAVALVEGAVVLAKSVVYRALAALPWRRSLALALVVNTLSTGLGLLYYAIAR